MSIDPTQGVSRPEFASVSGTRSGTISDVKNGQGSFSSTFSRTGNSSTVDTTISFANGTTLSREAITTYNADGSFSRSVTGAGPNGRSFVRNETDSAPNNGSVSISGSVIGPSGAVDSFSGTQVRSAGTATSNLTFTDPKGSTASLNIVATNSAGSTTFVSNGTNFNHVTNSDTATISTVLSNLLGTTAGGSTVTLASLGLTA